MGEIGGGKGRDGVQETRRVGGGGVADKKAENKINTNKIYVD